MGHVKWAGPGPLTIYPGGEQQAICKARVREDYSSGVLMVDTPVKLLAEVALSPCVLLPADLDSGNIQVLLLNESLKMKAMPKGAIIAQFQRADIVTEILKNCPPATQIDPKLFNFGDSPIPEAWHSRLVEKLFQRTGVFSLEGWDVGLVKGFEHHIRMNDTRPF